MPNDMKDVPKDRPILLKIDGMWIQAKWQRMTYTDSYWCVIGLNSHGCGCCGEDNPDPTDWAELPE